MRRRLKYDTDEMNWYLATACVGLILATILFFLCLRS